LIGKQTFGKDNLIFENKQIQVDLLSGSTYKKCQAPMYTADSLVGNLYFVIEQRIDPILEHLETRDLHVGEKLISSIAREVVKQGILKREEVIQKEKLVEAREVDPDSFIKKCISNWFAQSDAMPPIDIKYMIDNLKKTLEPIYPMVDYIEYGLAIFKIDSTLNTSIFLAVASLIILFLEYVIPLACIGSAVGILYIAYTKQKHA